MKAQKYFEKYFLLNNRISQLYRDRKLITEQSLAVKNMDVLIAHEGVARHLTQIQQT